MVQRRGVIQLSEDREEDGRGFQLSKKKRKGREGKE